MRQNWSPKRKLVTIGTVAIILPIIVLIVFEYISLSNIKRTRAIDAVIQRDFMQTLQVVERKSTDKLKSFAFSLFEEFSNMQLVGASEAEIRSRLDELLARSPFADAIYYYSSKRGLVMDDQQSREAQVECESLAVKKAWLTNLFSEDQFRELVPTLREYARKGEFKVLALPLRRSENEDVQIQVYFPVSPFEGSDLTVAGYTLSNAYLSRVFFPEIFSEMETESLGGERRDLKSTILAIHYINQPSSVIASSQPIDSGNFEVARIMGYGPWRFFVSEIKPKGETIEGISNHYLRWNFLLITFIVLVLIVGMMLTLGNMAREIQLAQLKSDFVSNVSHELKTPLALIRLFAETLELSRVKSPDRQAEYFSIIRKESERLTQLINNILDFSRIEAGKKEYRFEPGNLADVVRETIESYRYHIEQEGFILELDVDENIPSLRFDRDAISQALLNLLNNAVKYSKEEKSIRVTLSRRAARAQLEVEDQGIGIAKGEQKKIFEKFYRASNSLVQDTKGSGLGLSLVQHIVKAHGGTVRVESRVGEGSRFVIQLPLREVEQTQSQPSETTESDSSTVISHTEHLA